MIDLRHIKGNIANFALIGEEENWKRATLFISYDDKNYKHIASGNIQSICGYVTEFTDEEITVVLRFGKIDFMSPTVLALIGKEVIKFESAKLIGKNKYKIN